MPLPIFIKLKNGNLLHVDAYRLSGTAEFADLGLDEYFEDAVTFIEWGRKIVDEFPDCLFIDIELHGANKNHRSILLTYQGERWMMDFEKLKEAVKMSILLF